MGALYIIFWIIVILDIISINLLCIKKGKYAKVNSVIYGISLYGLILSYIQYTSAPSNYIHMKILALFYMLCSISILILKKNNFELGKMILMFLLICSTITIFFM